MKEKKIAIHANKGGFSEHFIKYCDENNIPYKIVNCYSNSIIEDVTDCYGLMWHPLQLDIKAEFFFKQLQYSLQLAGKKVFPDFNTVWHFDDKVGQKYLLEAVNASFVKTYVFYNKPEALDWAAKTDYPKVFKLRNGAGSKNVLLAKNKTDARNLIRKAFGSGFAQYNKFGSLKERIRKYKLGLTGFRDVLVGFYRLLYTTNYATVKGHEKGYVYFQDFIPDNSFDTRIIVIGNKAFGIKRLVRKNDFRASGGGHIIYDRSEINIECLKVAFEINKKIQAQVIAYDFILKDGVPLIIEISYGFRPSGYYDCPGYWDETLNWHEGKFNPYGWIVEDLLKS